MMKGLAFGDLDRNTTYKLSVLDHTETTVEHTYACNLVKDNLTSNKLAITYYATVGCKHYIYEDVFHAWYAVRYRL